MMTGVGCSAARVGSSVLALGVWALSLVGCAEPVEAPDDLNGLTRFFFRTFEPADREPALVDREIMEGVSKLHAALDAASLEELRGTLDDITVDELTTVGMEDRDPSITQGLFIANIIRCPLDELERIVLEPDQLALYPDAYAEYRRTFDVDRPAHLPTWTITYTSPDNPLFSNQFTVTVRSGLRKVAETEGAAHGRVLLRRGFMPEPAVFEEPSDAVGYAQDYQVELYYERAPAEIVHLYGIWRFMKLGALGDSTGDLLIDQTLSGMLDWDKKTDALCAR